MKRFLILKSAKVPSLFLACALQLFPMSRTFVATAPRAVTSSFAIVSTWIAGIAALLGSYDTVSGVSTRITSPETAEATNGTPFAYRITTGPEGANRFAAEPLPGGLSVSTTSGRITGTPLEDGVFAVLLTASDNWGPKRTVTKNLILTVLPGPGGPTPPAVLADPISRTATNGGAAKFTVTASGSGPLRYSWRLNGTPLPGATNSILALTAVSTNQAGDYSVVVTNGLGSVTSASAALTVVVRPFISAQPIPQTAMAGAEAIFSVEAGGTDPLTYQWRRNGANLPGSTNSTLQLTNLASTQAGTYAVVISNAVGSVTSAPVALMILQTPLTPLTLNVAGNGSVSPLTDGQFLEVGTSYTIKALPSPGNVFSNWIVGGQLATGSVLTFTMISNLAITANFVANPFSELKGSYSGLFYPAGSEPPQEQSGAFTLMLTDKGTYSSKLLFRGSSIPLAGSFGLDLATQKTIVAGGDELTLRLQLVSGSDHVSGVVSNVSFTSDLFGYRSAFHSKLNPATNLQGKYTMLLNAANDLPPVVSGPGYAAISVASSGAVLLKGSLADGTPLVQKGSIAANGQLPFFANLYTGKGSAFGWLTWSNAPDNDISGLLLWTKKEGLPRTLYTSGLTNELSSLASRYTLPAGAPVLNVSDAVVVLQGGNLANATTNAVVWDAANRITVGLPNTNQLTLKLVPGTGLLNGTFLHPGSLRKTSIRGTVLQKQNIGGGYFPGTNDSGRLLLIP